MTPMVLVRKKDRSEGFCADYRKLNTVTIKDAYSLLRIDDILTVFLFSNVGFGEWLLANEDGCRGQVGVSIRPWRGDACGW